MSTSTTSDGSAGPQYPNGHPNVLGSSARYRPCEKDDHDLCRVRTCTYCDESYQHGYDEEYCCERCHYNGIAYDALRRIRHDHTRCVSCFRRLKILVPPGRNHRDSPKRGVGLLSKGIPTYDKCEHEGAIDVGGIVFTEIAEPCYEWDVGEEFAADPLEGDWSFTPRDVESTKVCECGVAHHGTVGYGDDHTDGGSNFRHELGKYEAKRRAQRLADILEERQRRDDWDHEFDREALIECVWTMKTNPEISGRGMDFTIFEWALGYAVRRAD